jgi:hypothetical protein
MNSVGLLSLYFYWSCVVAGDVSISELKLFARKSLQVALFMLFIIE